MADNPYLPLLQDDTEQGVRSSMLTAIDKQPDAEAKLQNLAKRYNLPVEAVRLNKPEIETRAAFDSIDYRTLARDLPGTSAFLSNPEKAAIAHDNIGSMGQIERTIRQFGGGLVGQSVGGTLSGYGVLADVMQRTVVNDFASIFLPEPQRGPMGLVPQKPTIESLAGPLIGEGLRDVGGMVKEKGRAIEGTGEKTFWDQVAGGLGQVVGQIPMSILTRGTSLYAQGADVMNEKIAPDIANQRDKDLAVLGGAAVTGVTEAWALDKLLGPLAVPMKSQIGAALARIGIASAAEGGQEFSENVIQDVIRKSITNRDAEINIGQSIEEGGVGAAVGGIVRTIVESALHVRTRGARKVEQAEQGGQAIADLSELVKADKLLQRDPQSFEQFIKDAAEGGPVEKVYIDAQTLMQSGVAEQVAAVSPAVAEQLEIAAQTGAQIAIPVEEYTARIAPTDFAQGLLDHVKTDPDGFSRAEAQEYMQSQGDQLQQEVERALTEQQGDEVSQTSQAVVKAQIQQELDALGRFTPEKNETDAALFSSYYAVRAAQLGVTPEQFYEQRKVRFAAQRMEGLQLDQGQNDQTGALDDATGLPLNSDGTVTVYHHTSAEKAAEIRQSGVLKSAAEPDLYFTTTPETDTGYGDTAIPFRVKPDRLLLDDEFPGGRQDFRVETKTASKSRRVRFLPDGSAVLNQGGSTQKARGSFGRIFNVLRNGEKVGEVVALEQDAAQATAIDKFGADAVAVATTEFSIALLKGADLSTALHEGAHFFFENDIALAAELVKQNGVFESDTQSEGERQIVADVSALMNWHGIKGTVEEQLAQWYTMDFEQKRVAHERTAESFEAYLFNGNAPSIELAPYFQKFRAWLLNVYKSLKSFLEKNPEAGKLDDSVRSIFDRMLATSEQIKTAEQSRSMLPLFANPEQAGMTPEEFAAYQEQGIEPTAEAIDKLQARGLRDLAWARNAHGREIKKLQKSAEARRKEVRIEVRREVMSQPVYRAWQFLTATVEKGAPTEAETEFKKELSDWEQRREEYKAEQSTKIKAQMWEQSPQASAEYASPQKRGMAKGQFLIKNKKLVEVDSERAAILWEKENQKPKKPEVVRPETIEQALGELGKLQLSEVESLGLPAGFVEILKDRKMTGKDGFHPDIVAEEFGFTSGDQLTRELVDSVPPEEAIENLTDQRMLERFGDLATPGAIDQAADKAIHNEARARMVATEANALAQATGQQKILLSAAKEFAAQIVARLKVRDVQPSRFANAAARAAVNAMKASKAGDIQTAATEKRNQVLQLQAAKAAHDARDEVDSSLKYLKKFGKESVRKNLDQGYVDQIDTLLEKYDLQSTASQADRRQSLATWVQSRLNAGELPAIAESLLTPAERSKYLAQVQSRDESGDLVYKDDEAAIALLAQAIERSAKRSHKDMTVEEFRGLVDTVKNIEHLGRLKNKILTARDQKGYEAIRDDIAAGIVEHAKQSGKKTKTANNWLGQKFQSIKQFGASHIKVATWARIMDGGKDNGPVWRYLLQPANERATMETEMRAKATEALDKIMRPVLSKVPMSDKVGKGKFFPSLNESMNWQERFAVALNIGNESNMQRLLGGKGWTFAQVKPVLDGLTAEEWTAVQAVWDHFETYRPLIAEKELRVTGKEPEWIKARQIDVSTADGQRIQLRGGYYPVVFDPRVNMKAEADSKSQEAKDMMKAAYSAATTQRGFIKQRVEELNGRPLMLNLQGLYTGVNNVIHDLSWHEWVIDANKLLKSKTIDNAIREHYGPEVKREFDKWRDDIVIGSRRMDHGVERAAGFLRQSISASALTFNLLTAAMQPLGLSNSIARVGATWVGKGVARYVAAPMQSTREAQEKSKWLANRTRTRFRELNELRNQVQGQTAAKELMGKYGYWLMMRTQMMVDVPTWWGGYEKAIAEGQDEATAVQLADQGVKDAQGGGEEVDQSGIERGGAIVKLFTTFYSYMGSTLNVAYLAGKTDASKARAVANILLVTMAPVILGTLLKDALVLGGDDDDEDLLKKLAVEQVNFLLGMVVVGREFGQAAKMAFGEYSPGYGGPAGLRMIGDITKLTSQTAQGEFDAGFGKAFISVLGDLTGIPSVQINRTVMQGIPAVIDGETDGPVEAVQAITFGFQR